MCLIDSSICSFPLMCYQTLTKIAPAKEACYTTSHTNEKHRFTRLHNPLKQDIGSKENGNTKHSPQTRQMLGVGWESFCKYLKWIVNKIFGASPPHQNTLTATSTQTMQKKSTSFEIILLFHKPGKTTLFCSSHPSKGVFSFPNNNQKPSKT